MIQKSLQIIAVALLGTSLANAQQPAKVESKGQNPKVKLEQARASERGASDANSFDTDLFRTIEDVIHEHLEEAVVVPAVGTGATDSAILRNRGMIAYGFGSGVNTPELARTVHGHNERIAIENFRLSCELTFELTRRMCT